MVGKEYENRVELTERGKNIEKGDNQGGKKQTIRGGRHRTKLKRAVESGEDALGEGSREKTVRVRRTCGVLPLERRMGILKQKNRKGAWEGKDRARRKRKKTPRKSRGGGEDVPVVDIKKTLTVIAATALGGQRARTKRPREECKGAKKRIF